MTRRRYGYRLDCKPLIRLRKCEETEGRNSEVRELYNRRLASPPRKPYVETVKVPRWIREFLRRVGNELPNEMHLIDCGSWGCVYACGGYAIKVPLGLRDIIKSRSERIPTLEGGFVDRVAKELEILLKLDHDNILKLIDYSVNPPILVYELADGSLEDYGSLSLRDALLVAIQVCEALRYLHLRRIIHGDLKPSNILIVGGIVKVGDLSPLTHLPTTTLNSHQRTCTPGYCAPEQLFRDLGTSSKVEGFEDRIDVYQLANVILAMLGIKPLDGSEWGEDRVRERIMYVEIKELKDLLEKMLIREPWLRLSIDEVKRKLLAIWGKYFSTSGA